LDAVKEKFEVGERYKPHKYRQVVEKFFRVMTLLETTISIVPDKFKKMNELD
jgi:hypothetical protein